MHRPVVTVHGPLPGPSSPLTYGGTGGRCSDKGRGEEHVFRSCFCSVLRDPRLSGPCATQVPVSLKVFELAFANVTAFQNTVKGFQILRCDFSLILLKILDD